MKAAIQHNYGTPDVLTVGEVATPELGEHDVLVKVYASPITQGDRRLRAADYPSPTGLAGRLFSGLLRPRQLTGGTMYAGKVAAVGPAVTRFKPGQRVFGSAGAGAWAEYIRVREDDKIVEMAQGQSFAEAAALPYGAITALIFMRDMAEVKPGQKVAVVGAAGGVGRYAVQLARHLGADVTAVVRSRGHELVRDLGASEVIDARVEDFPTVGQRYDVIFDTTGKMSFGACKRALTPEGRYLTLIVSLAVIAQMLWTSIVGGPKALLGVAMGEQADYETIRNLVEAGALTPVVDRRFPLAQIVDAHRRLESGEAIGSVVVEPNIEIAMIHGPLDSVPLYAVPQPALETAQQAWAN